MDTTSMATCLFKGVTDDGQEYRFTISGCANETEARAKLIGHLTELTTQLKVDQNAAVGAAAGVKE